jgi:hypothetical protein
MKRTKESPGTGLTLVAVSVALVYFAGWTGALITFIAAVIGWMINLWANGWFTDARTWWEARRTRKA